MALSNGFDLLDALAAWGREDAPTLAQALGEAGIPAGPATAYLEALIQLDGPFPGWLAWTGAPWELIPGETEEEWRHTVPDGPVVAVVTWVKGRRVLRQGKDPFYWRDGPQDAKFGRDGLSDGVPEGIDPELVKRGMWVTDEEMRWVRWLSATMFWPHRA